MGEGCLNTGGVSGTTLTATGNAYLSDDTFQFEITGLPGVRPGLMVIGTNQVNGGLGAPFGDGLRCVSGSLARSQIQFTFGGTTTFSDWNGFSFGDASFGAGVTANYQFWYRDALNACSGVGFNFSNAWSVTWLP